MSQVTLPYSLIANTDEDVTQLMADLIALRDGVNNIDASQIVDGTIGAAELAAGAVTSAKILDGTIANGDLNTNIQNPIRAPAYALGQSIRAFSANIAVPASGWQTIVFPFGFTCATTPVMVVGAPQALTNGASLTAWSLAGWGTTSVTVILNNSSAQQIQFHGLVFGTI